MQVIGQFEAAKVAKGPVRDHRALCLNLDDHMRVCFVVKAKASNYRSFPGVVTHPGPSKLPLNPSPTSLSTNPAPCQAIFLHESYGFLDQWSAPIQ